jgi:two-component system phosphate regulon sensor histidine kinase PhoR
VTIREDEEDAIISFTDTGIGIPKAEQDRVFERFYRVDKSHSRTLGGTGLGLSIVKHAAQVQNACVEMESEPDRGTTITVRFPFDNEKI